MMGLSPSAAHPLLDADEPRPERDGVAAQVEREVQGGQDLADLLNRVQVDGAHTQQFQRLLQDGADQLVIPYWSGVGAVGQQQALQRAGSWLLVVEGEAGGDRSRGDALWPLVHQQPGEWWLCQGSGGAGD